MKSKRFFFFFLLMRPVYPLLRVHLYDFILMDAHNDATTVSRQRERKTRERTVRKDPLVSHELISQLFRICSSQKLNPHPGGCNLVFIAAEFRFQEPVTARRIRVVAPYKEAR